MRINYSKFYEKDLPIDKACKNLSRQRKVIKVSKTKTQERIRLNLKTEDEGLSR